MRPGWQNYGQLLVIRAISGHRAGLPDAGDLLADVGYLPAQPARPRPGHPGGHRRSGHRRRHAGLGFTGNAGPVALGLLSFWGVQRGLGAAGVAPGRRAGARRCRAGAGGQDHRGRRSSAPFLDQAGMPNVWRIPTIWVAIAQGLAGSMPWVVMGLYFITWLVRDRGLDEQDSATIAVCRHRGGHGDQQRARRLPWRLGRWGQPQVRAHLHRPDLGHRRHPADLYPAHADRRLVAWGDLSAVFRHRPVDQLAGQGRQRTHDAGGDPAGAALDGFRPGDIYRERLCCAGGLGCRLAGGPDRADARHGMDDPGALDYMRRSLLVLLYHLSAGFNAAAGVDG